MANPPRFITTEDVEEQKANDNAAIEDSGPGGYLGHIADFVSDHVAKAVAGIPGFIGDLGPATAKLMIPALPIKPALPGMGPVSHAAQVVKQRVVGPDIAPRNTAERYAGSAIEGVVGAAGPGAAASVPRFLSTLAVGAASGGAAEAAHELFPNSQLAPLAAGFLGMIGAHRITSHFGARAAPIAGASTFHQGVDIAVPEGTVIKAPEGGTVTRVGSDKKAGNWVEIDHGDGVTTKYLHLSHIDVQPGDPVEYGAPFARSGKTGNVTGPHLHWAAFKDGKPIDPLLMKGEAVGREVPPMRPKDMADAMNDPDAVTGNDNEVQPDADFENWSKNNEDLQSGGPGLIDRMNPDEPNTDATVYNLSEIRDTKKARAVTEDHQKANDLLDYHLDQAHDIQDSINDGNVPLTLNELKEEAQRAADIRDAIPENHPLRYKGNELAAMYDDMVKAYHADPIAEKAVIDSSHEKMTGPIRKNEPANLNDDRFVGKLPKKGLAAAVKMDDGTIFIAPEGQGHIDINFDSPKAREHLRPEIGKAKPQPIDDGGFVTPDGTYLDRQQARKYAEMQGFAGGKFDDGMHLDALSYAEKIQKSEDAGRTNRTLPQILKDLLGDEEGSLKGSGDAERPDGEKLPPEIKTNQKLLLDRLGDALDQSTPLRREAEAAMAKERSRRLAAAYAVRADKGGEAGFHQELAALKGSMGRPKIASIRDWFSQHEIDAMYDIVNKSPALRGYETINAKQALNKLLGADYGEIPTAREVELLARAMPRQAKMWKRLLENEEGSLNLPDGAIKSGIVNVASLPRALKASFDFSAPFRQGMFLVGRKEFWKAMPGMFKSFFDEGHFEKVQDEIFNRPTYDLMNKAGLETTRNNAGLLDREEAFISQFAEKIPGVRHSERAYLAFLNKLRADVFDDFVKRGHELGIDFVQDPHYLKSAARFINSATGRGNLNAVTRDARVLTNVLFSPKLMKSRIDMLNPGFYVGLHPAVRVQAAKSGLLYAATVLSTVSLAAAAGADVETDPRSSDFLKIKIGHTRLDVTGGFQPYVRFYAQFLTGQQKTITKGIVQNLGWSPTQKIWKGVKQGPFKPTTRLDVLYRFMENKESPNMAEVTRLLRGSDAIGQPLGSDPNPITEGAAHLTDTKVNHAVNEVVNMFTPLIVSDTYQAYKDLGAKGLLTAIPNLGGVGVQTYAPKKKKHHA